MTTPTARDVYADFLETWEKASGGGPGVFRGHLDGLIRAVRHEAKMECLIGVEARIAQLKKEHGAK